MDNITATAAQRGELLDAMIAVIEPIDRAQAELSDLWQEYFGWSHQEDIPEYEAVRVGRAIRTIEGTLFQALTEFYMSVGISDWRGKEYASRTATRYQTVAKVDELTDKLRAKIDRMPRGEAREALDAERIRVYHLPDAEAIPLLEKLLAK